MSATIKIANVSATLDDKTGLWACENKPLEDELNTYLRIISVSGDDPNQARTIAEETVRLLGVGEVVSVDPVSFDPEVIY